MAVRPIVLYPDPVLLKPTRAVAQVDGDVRQLVRDMTETLYAAPGIGLAANQVGVSQQVCIVDLDAGERPDGLLVLVNPRIVASSGSQVGEEGCLSFPELTLEVERALEIRVEALNVEGERFALAAEGLLARVIQHECEHLAGQVFLRNLSAIKRELIKKQIRKRIQAGDWYVA